MDSKETAGVRELELGRTLVADALGTRAANLAMENHDYHEKLTAALAEIIRLKTELAAARNKPAGKRRAASA